MQNNTPHSFPNSVTFSLLAIPFDPSTGALPCPVQANQIYYACAAGTIGGVAYSVGDIFIPKNNITTCPSTISDFAVNSGSTPTPNGEYHGEITAAPVIAADQTIGDWWMAGGPITIGGTTYPADTIFVWNGGTAGTAADFDIHEVNIGTVITNNPDGSVTINNGTTSINFFLEEVSTGTGAPSVAPLTGEPIIYVDDSTGDTYTWDGTNWVQQNKDTVTTFESETGADWPAANTAPVTVAGALHVGKTVIEEFDDFINFWQYDGTNWVLKIQHGTASGGGGDSVVVDAAGNVVITPATGPAQTYFQDQDWKAFGSSTAATAGHPHLATDFSGGVWHAGKVALGLPIGLVRLHAKDGYAEGSGLLFEGVVDDTFAARSGAGTLLGWSPVQGAFRAGKVTGTDWDIANVGTASVAFGINNLASGQRSFSHGNGNESTGSMSFTMGNGLIASGSYATAFGSTAEASGIMAYARGGAACDATGTQATSVGQASLASARNTFALGMGNEATADFSWAKGENCDAYADGTTSWGERCVNYGDHSWCGGFGNTIEVGSNDTFVWGKGIIGKMNASGVFGQNHVLGPDTGMNCNVVGGQNHDLNATYMSGVFGNGADFEKFVYSGTFGYLHDTFDGAVYGRNGNFMTMFGVTNISYANWSMVSGWIATGDAWVSHTLGHRITTMDSFTLGSGRYNVLGTSAGDTADITAGAFQVDEQLFYIGNGYNPTAGRSNVITALKSGKVGVNIALPAADFHLVGNGIVSGTWTTSGEKLKKDIKPAVVDDRFMNIEVIDYCDDPEMIRKTVSSSPNTITDEYRKVGVRAEQIEEIYPDYVKTYKTKVIDWSSKEATALEKQINTLNEELYGDLQRADGGMAATLEEKEQSVQKAMDNVKEHKKTIQQFHVFTKEEIKEGEGKDEEPTIKLVEVKVNVKDFDPKKQPKDQDYIRTDYDEVGYAKYEELIKNYKVQKAEYRVMRKAFKQKKNELHQLDKQASKMAVEHTHKAVDYNSILMLTLKKVQEMQKEIDTLKGTEKK